MIMLRNAALVCVLLTPVIGQDTCHDDQCASSASSVTALLQTRAKVSFETAASEKAGDTTEAKEFYVTAESESVDGQGTLEKPFSSIQKCVEYLKTAAAGSACKLLSGTYKLDKTIDLAGIGDQKIITAADPANPPVIDGTKNVASNLWKPVAASTTGCRKGCYSAKLSGWAEAPWQLFLGEKMMINARWPNADWDTKSMFQATESWGFSSDKSTFSGPSQCAKDPPSGTTDCTFSGVTWQYNTATKICENINKMECRNAMKGGMVPNTKPAECYMHDDTPEYNATGSLPLAQETFDASGASVILNVGHWTSYAGKVKKHTGGSFTYDSRPGWNVLKFIGDHTVYYLENHIQLLDRPGEWFYDKSAETLYVMTDNNADPSTFSTPLSARVLDYAFKITGDSSDLTISNLKFFASTVYAAGDKANLLTGLTLDGLVFDYPSAQKRMLGDVDTLSPTTIANHPTKSKDAVSNVIKNCEFRYTDASPTLDLTNPGFTISNNKFEYIDWSAVSTITASKMEYRTSCATQPLPLTAKGCFSPGAATLELPAGTTSAPLLFERNTVAHHGASNGVGVYGKGDKNTLRLNRIYGKTDLQLDGGLASIPAGAANGVVMEKNWLYDSMPKRAHAAKWGARFDRGQSECSRKWGENGEISQNVVYHTNGINAKGNGHKIVQNTVLWSGHQAIDDKGTKAGARDINLYGSTGGIGTCECSDSDCKSRPTTCCVAGDDMTFENKKTVMAGNAMESGANKMGGLTWKISTKDVDDVYKSQGLVDVSYNTAGSIEEALRDPTNLDFRPVEGSVQGHQCIGAYPEGLTDKYWIPGMQELMPTVPVPPNGATDVRITASLAFNPARGARKHLMYVSKTKADLDAAVPERKFRKKIFRNDDNMYTWSVTNGMMRHSRTIYWRVDPEFQGQGQVKGPIWEFKIEDQPPAVQSSACIDEPGATGVLKDTKKDGDANSYLELEVVANGGFKARHQLVSVQLCIDATYPDKDMMRSLTFKLRHKKSSGGVTSILIAKPTGQLGKGVASINGCFDDVATGKYISDAAPWKPAASLKNLVANSGLDKAKQTFELHAYDQKADGFAGEVRSWSLKLCYTHAAAQTLDPNDTGVCQSYPY